MIRVSSPGDRFQVKLFAIALGISLALCPFTPNRSWAGKKLQYNRSIRPILAENCFACHGPDSAARKADLRLDRRDQAVKVKALVPGNADASEIVRRIESTDPDEMMPPPVTKKSLTKEEKATLRRWIQEGAEYQQHWSLLPPTRPEPPAVKNAAWVRNPIDNFVLAKLEERGLSPAPEADRRALARRLSLDLIGLPPEPAEVAAFVNDKSPNAYRKLVDHFLESPHWGEHRGRYWLDAARYADTNGIHFDNYREIWAYRDWVINAFNANMPFDRFSIEQLAGDLLPHHTLDQQIASGFNRCNITTNEGGAIAEEYLVLYDRDRTETTSQVWLGLTAGCAVCHDHKFDPLTTREFYSMAAFFNNTTQPGMDGNIKDTPPIVLVPRREDRTRWATIGRLTAEIDREIAARKQGPTPEFEAWQAQINSAAIASLAPRAGLELDLPLNEGTGKTASCLVSGQPRPVALRTGDWTDGPVKKPAISLTGDEILAFPAVGDFEGDHPFACCAWVRFPRKNMKGAIVARSADNDGNRGWEIWLQDNRISVHLFHSRTDLLKVVARQTLTAGRWHHVAFSYDGTRKAAGVRICIDGMAKEMDVTADRLTKSIHTSAPLTIGRRQKSGQLAALDVQGLKVFDRALNPLELARLAQIDRITAIADKPQTRRTAAEKGTLLNFWLANVDTAGEQLTQRKISLQKEQGAIKAAGTVAHVMNDRDDPAAAYVLFRGAYDKRREQVTPATPAVLPPMPEAYPRNRLGLAKWLFRPEHPLTARVTVNRFWQEVFGTGIVRTTGDFGVTGELPSHPELLDWLAVEFRESGWDVKEFFRLLVNSAAYRQSVLATPEKLEQDPQNRLLSRGPRFRMDAEMVRDYALAASGLLVPKLGGPSVKPYQPPGVWEAVAIIGSNTRDYAADSGDKLYRRSMYTFWKRSAPPALLETFNAPSREVCTVRRERTDTPLQALATLNDPTFVEAARHLAQRTLTDGGSTVDGRLDFVAQRLLARPLTAAEDRVVAGSLKDLLDFYAGHPDDARQLISVGESKPDAAIPAAQLAAWTIVANEMLNLDEVLNK